MLLVALSPWTDEVQYDWVPEAVGADSSTDTAAARTNGRKKDYQTKPISYNPQGIKGLRLVSSAAGRLARQDRRKAPAERRYKKRTPLSKGGGPEGRQHGNYGLSEERRYRDKITKQTQFLITAIDTTIYTTVRRGIQFRRRVAENSR